MALLKSISLHYQFFGAAEAAGATRYEMAADKEERRTTAWQCAEASSAAAADSANMALFQY